MSLQTLSNDKPVSTRFVCTLVKSLRENKITGQQFNKCLSTHFGLPQFANAIKSASIAIANLLMTKRNLFDIETEPTESVCHGCMSYSA